MDIIRIHKGQPGYPKSLRIYLSDKAPKEITAIGNPDILLKGKQPVIVCPARSIETMRTKKEYRQPIEAGRLLLLSPFNNKLNRISSKHADKRNYFVAALSDKIFIPYAAPGSKTESLRNEWIKKGKPVFTFNDDYKMPEPCFS